MTGLGRYAGLPHQFWSAAQSASEREGGRQQHKFTWNVIKAASSGDGARCLLWSHHTREPVYETPGSLILNETPGV